jgi:hypothetical protein
MNRRTVIIFRISILVLALSAAAFRWPLNSGKITSTFGESRGDHLHDGTDQISGDKNVFPPLDGKLLYAWNKALFPFDNYTGSGNYKILSHDNGLLSVFLHLENSENTAPSYTENDSLAYFGDTGRSYGAHIHFNLIDRKTLSSINPLTILPAYKDTRVPVVGPFGLEIEGKAVIVTNKSRIRMTKDWPFLVKAYDEATGGERLGIYHLTVVFNDEQVADYLFDKIEYVKNDLTISGQKFENLYSSEGFYKVPSLRYRSGVNTCVVTASDFSGNKTVSTFTIDITLDRK